VESLGSRPRIGRYDPFVDYASFAFHGADDPHPLFPNEVIAMQMVSLQLAMEETGHRTRQAFYQWVERYNARNPNHMILRRHGRVDAETLRKAIVRLSRPAAEKVES
jgi:hypothetical protein